MASATTGDTVAIRYTIRLEDGTIVDASTPETPVKFTLGTGAVIGPIDRAIAGMEPGESKQATVSADDAFGPYRRDLVAALPREHLPPDLDPQVGQQLQAKAEDGRRIDVRVTEVSATTVTLDANHRLAGQDLVVDVELVDVAPPAG